jgi:hypothetical protein
MLTMLYSKLSGVLLSAVVLVASVGWCCAHNPGDNPGAGDTGSSMAGHAHKGSPASLDLAANTSSPTRQGDDPSHGPDDDGSDCQDKITMLSRDFTGGAVYSDSGPQFRLAPAFTIFPDRMAWVSSGGRATWGIESRAGTFNGDSLRALSCLATL